MKRIVGSKISVAVISIAVVAMSGCTPWIEGTVDDYYYSPSPEYGPPAYNSPWYQPAPPPYIPGGYPWYGQGPVYPPQPNRPVRPPVQAPPVSGNKPDKPSNRPGNTPSSPGTSTPGQRPGAVQRPPAQNNSNQQHSPGSTGGAAGRH